MAGTLDFLQSSLSEFRRYKLLGDKTFKQLNEEDIHWQPGPEANNIAVIVKHLSGNMLSRWTDFLTSDGEKSWRDRDSEFVDSYRSKTEMLKAWERGWEMLFKNLDALDDSHLQAVVRIRNEEHSVVQAIQRQLGHAAYHVGQIVLIGRMILGDRWQSLSIPKGGSEAFNRRMFGNKQN